MCKQLNEDETQLFQCTFILTVPSLKQKRGTYRNEGANSIGAFINKDKFEGGGACQTGGAYWKEGAKTNHYGISLLQHQNYCDQTNQTMYFSRTLGEGSGSRDRYDGTFSKRS